MRDSPLIHKRQIHRLTKEIYQTTKEFHQLTKEIYRPTKAIHQITKAIQQLTKEIHRLSKEIYLKTKEFYQASKDGTLQMKLIRLTQTSVITSAQFPPSGYCWRPFGLCLRPPRGQPVHSLTLADKPWLLRPLRGLGRPSGQPATYLW